MAIRAYSYVRTSETGNAAASALDMQRRAISQYAEQHGIEITGEFADIGIAGYEELSEKKELARMIGSAGEEDIRMVLVSTVDRLNKELGQWPVMLGLLQWCSMKAIAVDTGMEIAPGSASVPYDVQPIGSFDDFVVRKILEREGEEEA